MKTEPTEAIDLKALVNYFELNRYQKELVLNELETLIKNQSSPKIKQLEWEDTDMWYFKAKTSLGLGYSITEIKGTYIVHFGDAPISWEKSLESAKSAAQADFEQRIKECLA